MLFRLRSTSGAVAFRTSIIRHFSSSGKGSGSRGSGVLEDHVRHGAAADILMSYKLDSTPSTIAYDVSVAQEIAIRAADRRRLDNADLALNKELSMRLGKIYPDQKALDYRESRVLKKAPKAHRSVDNYTIAKLQSTLTRKPARIRAAMSVALRIRSKEIEKKVLSPFQRLVELDKKARKLGIDLPLKPHEIDALERYETHTLASEGRKTAGRLKNLEIPPAVSVLPTEFDIHGAAISANRFNLMDRARRINNNIVYDRADERKKRSDNLASRLAEKQ